MKVTNNKIAQSSLWDNFFQNFEEIKKSPNSNIYDKNSANYLYSMWRAGASSGEKNVFKRPEHISKNELDKMENEGLINVIDDNIVVTEKGASVLKVMILGDSRSELDLIHDGSIVDYETAKKNIRG